MRNIHDPNEYHKFNSTKGGSNNGSPGKGTGGGPGFGGWVVIIVFAYFFLFFIFSGASWEAIETLLAFGIIAFFIARSLFK